MSRLLCSHRGRQGRRALFTNFDSCVFVPPCEIRGSEPNPLIYRTFTFFTFVTPSFKAYSRQKITRAPSPAPRRKTHSVYKKTHSTGSHIPLLRNPLRPLRKSPPVVQLICTFVQITLQPCPKPNCSKPSPRGHSASSHPPSTAANISSQNPRLSDAKRNFSLTPKPPLARFFPFLFPGFTPSRFRYSCRRN